jgi:GrpB-like predicted nucleotidyltransferase (UPF0157 family)/SAM-dependent methyltransferase
MSDKTAEPLALLQEHDPQWARHFHELREVLAAVLQDRAAAIHHIGSTSIPGMLAKPILDLSVELAEGIEVSDATAALAALGYRFQGDLGIAQRYAYARDSEQVPRTSPPREWMNHHLYVCPHGSPELARSLHFRDSLVACEELRSEYRVIKEHCVIGADRKLYQSRKDEWGDAFFKRVLEMRPLGEAVNGAYALEQRLSGALEAGEIDEAEWYRQFAAVITPAYLRGDNPRSQSGYGGDDERWRHARGLIADAIERDGTFLDVGCASGYLMQTLTQWASEKGVKLEPYGLDISSELAELARARLPQWRERIFVGNALGWRLRRRFDFVRSGLEYVPPTRQRELIQHLLYHVVAPGGRLIIGTYNEATESLTDVPLEQKVREMGFVVSGRSERRHRDCRLRYRVFWIDV